MQADVSILDEIDSGLDIDALREVATAVNGLKTDTTATLMVTHYQVKRLHGAILLIGGEGELMVKELLADLL